MTQHDATLEALAQERVQVSERAIARLILDRAMKRGRLAEADLVAEIALAFSRRRARDVLALAAGDVIAERRSGSDAELVVARAFLADVAA